MEDNFSWQLRAFRAAVSLIIAPLLFSCEDRFDQPTACLGGECDARMIFGVPADENGFYHIELNWSGAYWPYFAVDIEASEIHPEYRYNGVSVVSAAFETDKDWELGENTSLTVMNLVQSTSIYFSGSSDLKVYSKRIVGPIPPVFIGDTVTLKMDAYWDAGSESVLKSGIYEKFIVE